MKTIILKKLILSSFILTTLLIISCNSPKTTYYKEIKSGKILDQTTFNKMKKVMTQNINNFNNSKEKCELRTIIKDSVISGDSIIKTFEFDIKLSSKKMQQGIYGYVNRSLPELTLTTLKGEKIELAQLKGKPTLINFWFTTCHPCVDEIPVLNKLQKKYKGKVHFISVTFNTKDQVKTFLKSHTYNFTKIVEAQNFINTLKIHSFPVNVFLDKNGVVKRVENGIPYNMIRGELVMGNGKQFEHYLNTLL